MNNTVLLLANTFFLIKYLAVKIILRNFAMRKILCVKSDIADLYIIYDAYLVFNSIKLLTRYFVTRSLATVLRL